MMNCWRQNKSLFLKPMARRWLHLGPRLDSSRQLPNEAKVVVCGGGAVGCSVAYHLAKEGIKDVLLLEQGSVSCGTSWHAAGLVSQIRDNVLDTRMCNYIVNLLPKLEEEVGLSTGWKQCGSLYLARNKDRMTVLRRTLAKGNQFGIEAEILTPEKCLKLSPLINIDDIIGGLYVPSDGVVDPSDLCRVYTKAATQRGARVMEKVCVEGVKVERGHVTGIQTDQGEIDCEIFVNCGGQWARDIGKLSNPAVPVPLHSAEHYYIVTKPIEGIYPMMPVTRDQCGYFYFREWSGGIAAGGFEPRCKPCFHEGIPKPYEFMLMPEDWDHFQILMDQMLHRIPALKDTEIRQLLNGAEAFTPDHRVVLGEAPNIKNYFVAAGMNSAGINRSAGIGKVLAEWIAAGEPQEDVSVMDIKRFSPHQNNKRFLRQRITEVLSYHYVMPWPKLQPTSGRGLRLSPLHHQLDAAGAAWGEEMGWETPNWFTTNPNESRCDDMTFGRPNWFDKVKDEVAACRNSAAVFDLSPQAKFEIKGDQVLPALEQLCAGRVGDVPGSVVHSVMLNYHGGVESTCFITCLDSNRYHLMTPGRMVVKAEQWLREHLPSSLSIVDITTQYSVMAVVGPNGRQLLQQLTLSSLDQNSFPDNSAKELELGMASDVLLINHHRLGQQTWEIVVPTESACGLYDQLMAVGRKEGLCNAGRYTMDNMRVEYGLATMGNELGSHTSPWEAGLTRAIDLNKSEFIGRDAIIRMKQNGVQRVLAQFSVTTPNQDTLIWGGESIYCGEELVGSITSAGYNHTTDQPIGLGFVKRGTSSEVGGPVEIEINGTRYPAKITGYLK